MKWAFVGWYWSEWQWGIDRNQWVSFVDLGPLCFSFRRRPRT